MQLFRRSLEDDAALLDISASNISDVFRAVVDLVGERGLIEEGQSSEVLAALNERERLGSTAIGHAVAIPHAYRDCIKQQLVIPVRLKHALNMGAPDGIPTRFIFIMLGPEEATIDHIDTLTNLARLMADEEFRYEAGDARDTRQLLLALDRYERRTAPGAEVAEPVSDDALAYSGRLGGGILTDLKRRLPWYVDDFREGLHPKALSSTLFLFFACLAPAIIFGGLMGDKTGGQIGAVEMIVASAFCGIVYAIFAGQPLIILGGTGPMLIFTEILYSYCAEHELAFLPIYTWVGLWTALFLIIMSVTDASCLMRYFTRFTDEIFAALISVIFIYEAVDKLIGIYHKVELDESIGYDVANLSLLLALGTFYVAMSLSRFRNSHLLLPAVREFLADFGPAIAIVSMAGIAFYARNVTQLEPLPAPDSFGTTTGRPWFVPLFDAPTWAIWAAMAPGLLCSLLVFLDQNITARLVNSPDNNLQKGASYHYDLSIVALLVGVCSLFGLPWLVAATVRSLNHLRSLANTEEVVDKSGASHTHILHVRENRLTGVSIHILIGLSLLLLAWLHYVPLAVLYGLFLYMGIVSMKGNQFFERISLWLTDPALYPRTHYVRRVPNRMLHLFTFIQLLGLVALWVVKTSTFGILFPIFIALLVPFRFMLGYFFQQQELDILDAEENPEEEGEAWS